MSFGQELKEFSAAFGQGYKISSDRQDKKEERRRHAISDPIDNEYKVASTDSMKKRTAWYDDLSKDQHDLSRKSLQYYDQNQKRLQTASDIQNYNFMDRIMHPRGPAGERLDGDAPEGEPEPSDEGPGDVGDHAAPAATSAIPDDGADAEPDADADDEVSAEPASYNPNGASTQDIYTRFMRKAYDSGVTNPNGLAAIAATATRESKFSPGNLHRTWSDPSESGEAGTSGYLMSWRGKRLTGLRQFAKDQGEDPMRPSPETQAAYLFHEDPGLKQKLNSAKTPQDAQRIMNQSWAFAGYDRDSPEARARYQLADNYGKKFGQFLSRGGLVVRAASGGAIPALPVDDEEDEDLNKQPVMAPAPQQALPVDDAPVPTERPMDQPDAEEVTPEGKPLDVGYDPRIESNPRIVGFTKAHEAVLDGMRYSLKQAGIDTGAAVQDPDRARKMSEFLKGAGAAPKKIIDQAYDAVDPDKKLPESERTMAALGMVYDHYTKRGEAGKAKAAAASIVQYQRKLFQQYSSIAKAAIQDGDIDAGAKAAIKAYSAVPDGQDMKVKKLDDGRYQITLTDEATGKTISKPVLTPQEIGGWAMQVNPGSFDEFIMDAAGQRKQGGGPPSKEFQALAAGMDEGKMPSNADMAALPIGEQKELRMRAAAAAKAAGGGGAKPLTFGDTENAGKRIGEAWDAMASLTEADEQGNDVPVHPGMNDVKPADMNTMKAAATNMLGTPHNRSADGNVSEQDAIMAASMVSQSDGYKVTDRDGGTAVELPDGTEVWMRKSDFIKLSQVYKRQVKAAKKQAQDATNAAEDDADKRKRRAEIDKKNREENPGLLGDQAIPPPTMGGTPQSAIDDLQKLMGQ